MLPSLRRSLVRCPLLAPPHLRPACRVSSAKPCSTASSDVADPPTARQLLLHASLAAAPACRAFSAKPCSTTSSDAADPPTTRQLLLHARLAAVPMVGFGFMDNVIMIQAGDFIDGYLGAHLGITTLTAAAMGNVCSDSSGVLFGGVVESASEALNLERPHFTEEQAAMGVTRHAGTAGSLIGVVCGCCLGMTTLLFQDLDARERMKRAQQLDTIFSPVVTNCRQLTKSEACTLYLYDEEKRELWSKVKYTGDSGEVCDKIIKLSIDAEKGIASAAARTHQLLNIPNAELDPLHDGRWAPRGFVTRQVLCMPILDSDDNLYGVIQCINKEGGLPFTKDDENLLKMVSRHVQIFVACINEGE